MSDGAYERRGPREAELKRLQRLIDESRRRAVQAPCVPKPSSVSAQNAARKRHEDLKTRKG